MHSRRWHCAAAIAGTVVAMLVGLPSASADVLPPNSKLIRFRMVLRADRFDDYTEHRLTIGKGGTFDAIATKAYGDASRSKEIAAANPTLEATRLPVDAKILLPPKLVPPKDAKETLAWTFWGHANLSGFFALQRVYPDEEFAPGSVFFGLVAVPADRLADFEKLIEAARQKDPKRGGVRPEDVLNQAPWAIPEKGLQLDKCVDMNSPAAESMTTFRITELVRGEGSTGRFVVAEESVEYRDYAGNVVAAGIGVLLTWRAISLGLIALIGWFGLRRMRRARGGAAVGVAP